MASLHVVGRLVFAEEEERRRIARELHDQFGQRLTALKLQAGRLKAQCGGQSELRRQAEALEVIAAQLDQDIDCLVWELRPTALDDLGLRAALADHLRTWSSHAGISAELATNGITDDRLPPEIETTLYRIAQEALTNIAKHANATHVDVVVERCGDHVSLVVEDDGVGFDRCDTRVGGQRFGLLGMQERAALVAGTVQIESAIGQGTTVLVRVPTPVVAQA